MTTATSLLAELGARGLRVRAVDGMLCLKPADALTAELRERVLTAKPELLRLLQSQPPLCPGLAVRQVLGFNAALLSDLPIPTTLVLDVHGVTGVVTVATHPSCSYATFDADEWRALRAAAERAVVRPNNMVAWCRRKQNHPHWRMNEGDAFGPTGLHPRCLDVGEVLRRLGATLRAVALEGGAT